MKFCILSDTHYITRDIMEDGGKTLLERGERLTTVLAPVLTEKALEQVGETDCDTVLITGDLTNWGDRPSHENFRELLRALKAKGKRVLVTTATHDFHHNIPYVQEVRNSEIIYTESPWNLPHFDLERSDVKYHDCVSPEFKHLTEEECRPHLFEAIPIEELADFYREFGIDEAISVHQASGSYCAQLDSSVRVLMLNDNFRNEEAMEDISVTYSPSCFRWIRDMLDDAQREGMFIFACTHHPLVPPSPAYKIGATSRNMRKPVVGHALADMGIKLVFSGHSHFCNTAFLRSEKGNLLYDISTPSTQSYPPQYRIAEISPESGDVKTYTVDVGEIDKAIRGSKTTKEYVRDIFLDTYRTKVKNISGIAGKAARETTCGKLFFLVRRASRLTKAEEEKIRNKKVFELGLELILNMLAGDGSYTPDTAEYKFVMGLSAVIDSLIDAQPFYDVRGKILKGYSICQTAQPLLFNNYISDSRAEFCINSDIREKYTTQEYSSSAGKLFMTAVSLLSILLSPLELLAVITAIPALSVKKITKLKQIERHPHDIYYY